MNLTTLIITFFISLSNISTIERTDSVRVNEIDYRDGVYYFNKKIFNGDIIDYYKNETLKFRYTVLNGRLNGKANEFYENGKVKSERTYYMSKLYGPFTEYYTDGKIKAKFDVKLNAYQKGEVVEKVTIGTIKRGKYKSDEYEKGVIYFITKNGERFDSSEHISILNQTKYLILKEGSDKVLISVE